MGKLGAENNVERRIDGPKVHKVELGIGKLVAKSLRSIRNCCI